MSARRGESWQLYMSAVILTGFLVVMVAGPLLFGWGDQ